MKDPSGRRKTREGGERTLSSSENPRVASGGKADPKAPSHGIDPALSPERAFSRLFVGAYTEAPLGKPSGSLSAQKPSTGSLGIHSLSLSLKSGFVSVDHTVMSNPNPTFLTKRGNMLLAAHEVADKVKAAVYRAHDDGSIEHISTIADKSGAECRHVALHPNGRWVYGSGYESGSLSCWPLRLDGSLGPLHARIHHKGGGPNLCRQKSPHIYSSCFISEGTLGRDRSENITSKTAEAENKPLANRAPILAVADLGTDSIVLYEAPANEGLRPVPFAAIPTPTGFGPCAMALRPGHPSQLAVVGELANSVIVYDMSSTQGSCAKRRMELQSAALATPLKQRQTSQSKIPRLGHNAESQDLSPSDGAAPEADPATLSWREISRFDLPSCCGIRSLASWAQFSPCGRWLYVSIRGKNVIAVYEMDEYAQIVSRGRFPCGGNGPRHFSLSPCGRYLAVANQESDNVVVFRAPKPADEAMEEICRISIPSPTCVIWG